MSTGGLAGLITIEDVIEELVGELEDEHDDSVEPIQPVPDGWQVLGHTSVDEIERVVGADVPTGVYDTVSGLIMHTPLAAAGTRRHGAVPLSDGAVLVARVDSVVRRVAGTVHLSIEGRPGE